MPAVNSSRYNGAVAIVQRIAESTASPLRGNRHHSRHDIDPLTGLPLAPGLQHDPTTRMPRDWGFSSNQLLVKVQYAFRY